MEERPESQILRGGVARVSFGRGQREREQRTGRERARRRSSTRGGPVMLQGEAQESSDGGGDPGGWRCRRQGSPCGDGDFSGNPLEQEKK